MGRIRAVSAVMWSTITRRVRGPMASSMRATSSAGSNAGYGTATTRVDAPRSRAANSAARADGAVRMVDHHHLVTGRQVDRSQHGIDAAGDVLDEHEVLGRSAEVGAHGRRRTPQFARPVDRPPHETDEVAQHELRRMALDPVANHLLSGQHAPWDRADGAVIQIGHARVQAPFGQPLPAEAVRCSAVHVSTTFPYWFSSNLREDFRMRQLRFAFRTLFKNPFVTVIAVLSLALGIGANTAIFSLFNELLRRPLPVDRPQELVNLSAPGPKSGLPVLRPGRAVRRHLQLSDVPRSREGPAGLHRHRRSRAVRRQLRVQGPDAQRRGHARLRQLLSRCSVCGRLSGASSRPPTTPRSASRRPSFCRSTPGAPGSTRIPASLARPWWSTA